MPYVSHISLSFRTHILHCLQMLVFFKASGLNVIRQILHFERMAGDVTLVAVVPEPPFLEVCVWVPHGVILNVCG